MKDIVVPIAKNTKAFTDYKCISLLVALRVKMVATVYFNDNLFFEANEIQDVVLKWNLPAKFNACKAAMSQKLPHHLFGGAASAATISRIRGCTSWPDDGEIPVTPTPHPARGLSALATLSHKGRGYPSKRPGCYTRIGIST